jgi:hypothetical protein
VENHIKNNFFRLKCSPSGSKNPTGGRTPASSLYALKLRDGTTTFLRGAKARVDATETATKRERNIIGAEE